MIRKRVLGKSSVEVTPVVLGAWAIGGWMWGGAETKESIRTIHASHANGITSVDTAPIYGFGYSEEVVGQAVKGKRSSYEILTKAGMRWDDVKGLHYFTTRDNEGKTREVYKYSGRESVISECEASLRRLGTDYIDLYQIHWPDDSTPIGETMEALQQLIDQGKIRAAGVSNYSVEQMEQASAVISLTSNQVPYSMVRREIEEDVVPWCIRHHCSILAYSPLQRGLLAGRISPDTPFAPGDSRPELPHFRVNNLIKTNQFLESIKPIALEKGVTLSQLVIGWTLQRPGISVALVGARNTRQAEQNARGASITLTLEEIETIDGALYRLNLDLD